jgi:hypothetical protein
MNKLIFLALILLYPCTALADAQYPSLGNGAALVVSNSVAIPGTTDVQFEGGATINSDTEGFSPSLSISPEQSVTIGGVIKVPPNNTHFGKMADIFAVGFNSPVSLSCNGKSEDGQYYELVTVPIDNSNRDDSTWYDSWDKRSTRAKTFAEWDGSLDSLKPFQTGVVLNESTNVQIITNSKFPNGVQGLLCITFGYRVIETDGSSTWAFNNNTIDVKIANHSVVRKITDPNTNVGTIIVSGEERVVTVAGDKDAQGNLLNITDVTLASVKNLNEWVGVHLNSDSLPDSITYADGSKASFTNYTDSGVDITIYDKTGNVKQTLTTPMDMEKLNEAKNLMKNQVKPEDFSAKSNSMPKNEFYCIPSSDDTKQLVQPNWVKGVFLMLDAVMCSTSIAGTIGTGGIGLPSTVWACGSFIVNFVEFTMETSGIKPPTILQETSSINSSIQTLKSCLTPTISSQTQCGLGLANVLFQDFSPIGNSKVPITDANTECDFCVALEQVCNKHKVDGVEGGSTGCFCHLTALDQGSFELITNYKYTNLVTKYV